jgi:hypothetical protein
MAYWSKSPGFTGEKTGVRFHGQSMERLAMTKGSDLLVAALENEGVDLNHPLIFLIICQLVS